MPKSIDVQTYTVRQVQDALKVTGELIAVARKERKWSQSELGRRLGGVDRRLISALESGDPGADFGLAVSALWVLNLPLLSTLPLGDRKSSGALGSLLDVMAKLSSSSGRSTAGSTDPNFTGHKGARKKEIDNDF